MEGRGATDRMNKQFAADFGGRVSARKCRGVLMPSSLPVAAGMGGLEFARDNSEKASFGASSLGISLTTKKMTVLI